jgi:hypothetical protein
LFEKAGNWQPTGFTKAQPGQWTFEADGVVPAIAIPVQAKQVFECPPEHIVMLDRVIWETIKVITIGWRGLEAHFLEKWQNRNDYFHLLIVTGDQTSGDETVVNLQTGGMVKDLSPATHYRREVFDGGFGDAIGTATLRSFLGTPLTA